MTSLLSVLSIIASFSQLTISDVDSFYIKGSILFCTPQEIYFEINNPINQLMKISEESTVIYYPDDYRAFNILHPKRNSMEMWKDVPLFTSIDEINLEEAGFTRVMETANNDTTLHQYIPEGKGHFPFITLKSTEGKTFEFTISISQLEYIVINIVEYGKLDNVTYLREYSVSSYYDSKLTEEMSVKFDDVRLATEEDIAEFKFEIPKGIDIEVKSLY